MRLCVRAFSFEAAFPSFTEGPGTKSYARGSGCQIDFTAGRMVLAEGKVAGLP